MPKIKNTCARLIVIEHVIDEKVEKFQFMPAGEAVDTPKSVVNGKYCQALIADGSLAVVGDSAETVAEDDLSDLRAQAAELGITVDKRWGSDRLSDEIEKALEK